MTNQRRRPWATASALGAIALALALAACTSAIATPSPTSNALTSAAPTPTPVDSATEPGGLAPCPASELVAEHGRIEGAAGSRFTTVTVSQTGETPCTVTDPPGVRLVDPAGVEVVVAGPAGGGEPFVLEPGDAAATDVRLANWCEPLPSEPMTIELQLDSATLTVDGGPIPVADLPPCNGPDGVILESGAWRVAS